MKIKKVKGNLCKTMRPLWEEVFSEDSIRFTEYYFETKAEKNTGYVIGEAPYDAMMFRTPYCLQIEEFRKEISYLVGVATREECRHKGYMTALLQYAFKEMYREKMPFTFLMPASPKIYEPFDFRYIYERDTWKLKEEQKPHIISGEGTLEEKEGFFSVKRLRKEAPQFPVMNLLAEFANEYLKRHYSVFVHRDEAYYETQLKELEAQNGDIYVLLRQGKIEAFFLYAKENNEIFIQEAIEEKEGTLSFLEKEEKKTPVIMARVIHLEEMLKLVRSSQEQTVVLQIRDEWLVENTGVYQWHITPKGSSVTKLDDSVKTENSLHISELPSLLLKKVFINEIV